VNADVAADLKELAATLAGIEGVLDIDRLRAQVAELQDQAARPDLWDDVDHAQQVNSKLAHLQGDLRRVLGLRQRLDDVEVLYELAEEGADESARREAETEHHRLRKEIASLEIRTLLAGEYDERDALMTMVRISPFDNQGRRQTSFAGVEVLPVTETTDHVDIPENEIRIDVFRSSGPGGQSVNTTDSAVRITHLPTGIVVSCQNEKSQIQNRAAAMRVLQSRLLERKRQEQQAEMDALKGEGSSWGNQMRSYVLHPYQMVKDLRTEHEVGNPTAVLDGDIDAFLESGIRWRRQQEARVAG
jgi:peptide chain release factor 2